jgi:hypothetical protein
VGAQRRFAAQREAWLMAGNEAAGDYDKLRYRSLDQYLMRRAIDSLFSCGNLASFRQIAALKSFPFARMATGRNLRRRTRPAHRSAYPFGSGFSISCLGI